jgi:hypothetical protein
VTKGPFYQPWKLGYDALIFSALFPTGAAFVFEGSEAG